MKKSLLTLLTTVSLGLNLLIFTQNTLTYTFNPETYDFYKGDDWKKSDSSYQPDSPYQPEMYIQQCMLLLKNNAHLFTTPQQKNLLQQLDTFTEQFFFTGYLFHTNQRVNEQEVESILLQWGEIFTKLIKPVFKKIQFPKNFSRDLLEDILDLLKEDTL